MSDVDWNNIKADDSIPYNKPEDNIVTPPQQTVITEEKSQFY